MAKLEKSIDARCPWGLIHFVLSNQQDREALFNLFLDGRLATDSFNDLNAWRFLSGDQSIIEYLQKVARAYEARSDKDRKESEEAKRARRAKAILDLLRTRYGIGRA
jgi:hypothetical protein